MLNIAPGVNTTLLSLRNPRKLVLLATVAVGTLWGCGFIPFGSCTDLSCRFKLSFS